MEIPFSKGFQDFEIYLGFNLEWKSQILKFFLTEEGSRKDSLWLNCTSFAIKYGTRM